MYDDPEIEIPVSFLASSVHFEPSKLRISLVPTAITLVLLVPSMANNAPDFIVPAPEEGPLMAKSTTPPGAAVVQLAFCACLALQ